MNCLLLCVFRVKRKEKHIITGILRFLEITKTMEVPNEVIMWKLSLNREDIYEKILKIKHIYKI